MSEQKIRKAFRTTKLKINRDTIADSGQRDHLEALFISLEAAKTDAVAAERAAAIAVAKSRGQLSKAQIAELEFLTTAAGHFTQVAGDRLWVVYRDAEGSITLEGYTERLLRNNMRAQQDMLGSQIANSGDENIDRSDLYETGDPEADNEHPDEE